MSITDLDKEQTAVQNEQDKAEENENVEELDLSDQEIEDDDNDEDWEDVEEHVQKIKKEKSKSSQNRLNLRTFCRECDRYKISNRAGAKLANALMKDIGFVTKFNTQNLVCPSKLRRERSKWGRQAENLHSEKKTEGGLYFDGKNVILW